LGVRRWKSIEATELATLEWIAWFHQQRVIGSLDYIPPVEAEENYYRLRRVDEVLVIRLLKSNRLMEIVLIHHQRHRQPNLIPKAEVAPRLMYLQALS